MRMRKTITELEINEIVTDYHRLLPEWQHVSLERLARADGPILQAIGFQCLSTGHYRPMNYVSVLVAPEPLGRGRCDFFVQMPKGGPQALLLREHKALQGQMFDAMRQEFKPPITAPLDASRLLSACERDAVSTPPQAYALAALNAYFGHHSRALYWCSQFPKLVDSLGLPWQEWHVREKQFLDSLQQWLENGEAKNRLTELLVEERSKWGFA